MSKLLISVHIPKTGGTSLLSEIRAGALGRHLLDYEDRVGQTHLSHGISRLKARVAVRLQQRRLMRDYDVIHGHFLARKYAFLYPEAAFMTFLREPVARVVSGYFYMKHVVVNNPVSSSKNPLVRQIADGEISLVDYARTPHQVDLYAKFLSGVTLEDYLLVGITERFAESIGVLNKLLGSSLSARHERSHDSKRYQDEYGPWMQDLEHANRENTKLYNEALRVFEKRLNTV